MLGYIGLTKYFAKIASKIARRNPLNRLIHFPWTIELELRYTSLLPEAPIQLMKFNLPKYVHNHAYNCPSFICQLLLTFSIFTRGFGEQVMIWSPKLDNQETNNSGTDRHKQTTNQNSLFRSRGRLSANQGPVFPDSVDFCLWPCLIGRLMSRRKSVKVMKYMQ